MPDPSPYRGDFPILARRIQGYPLAYLDNAATTQKPRAVIDALTNFYERHNANVHRGVHTLAEEASALYEQARVTMARFLGADSPRQIVFTRGTTDAINLVAAGWLRPRLQPGDEIVVTRMEHHSNIVPWQLVARERGALLRYAGIAADGTLDLEDFASHLSRRTRIVALSHVSNVLGTINPAREMADLAHAAGAQVVLDAAQSVAHLPIDVRRLDCDFLALSGHKMYGPTGIGLLYGKTERLEEMLPVQGGGGMIEWVEEQESAWAPLPSRLEAGTPNIAGAHGLAAAADYLMPRLERVRQWEADLTAHALERLTSVPALELYGPRDPVRRAGVFSFNLPGLHPHDVAEVLDGYGLALRAGHHCCQVLMRSLGITATLRASLALYCDHGELDRLAEGLSAARKALSA